MFVVGSFGWQCVLLYVLGGKVNCWILEVAMCVSGSFRWQCVVLRLLGGNVCCCMF